MAHPLIASAFLVGVMTFGVHACDTADLGLGNIVSHDSAAVTEAVVPEVPSTFAPSTTSTVSTTTSPPVVTEPPPPPRPPPPPSSEAVLSVAMSRVRSRNVLGYEGVTVLLSECTGDTGASHWGFYNNGANGGAITEPGGVVIPVGALCVNPVQPDIYSTLVHELGHKYFWEHNLWEFTKARFGGSERAAECFAAVFGATVFGEGGCSTDDVQSMRILLGV
jgi:hypothetical protein